MTMTKPLIRTLGCLAFLAFVFSVGLPAVAEAASKAPPGFIALSEKLMNWDQAKAWCKQHKGKLPRINDSDSWAWADNTKITNIDGFGAPGAPWPSGLSEDTYWTGTEHTGVPGDAWTAATPNFSPGYGVSSKSDARGVVCVP